MTQVGKRNGCRQWNIYFWIVSKIDTLDQKSAGKCPIEFQTASTDQKAGGSKPPGRTNRVKPMFGSFVFYAKENDGIFCR